MVGEAVTLRYLPYREDLNAAQSVADPRAPAAQDDRQHPGRRHPGDRRAGQPALGTLGEILMARLKARGAAGMVTDGAVRDAAGIRGVGLPTFIGGRPRLGQQHRPLRRRRRTADPVRRHHGGAPATSWWAMSDGVVVIPRAMAAKVADEAVHHDELEVYLFERISSGESLRGIYPPNEQTLRDYETWKRSR